MVLGANKKTALKRLILIVNLLRWWAARVSNQGHPDEKS